MLIYILDETSNFSNSWNYSFLIVALIAIGIGSIITFKKVFKSEKRIKKEQEKVFHDEKILDDPGSILKKK